MIINFLIIIQVDYHDKNRYYLRILRSRKNNFIKKMIDEAFTGEKIVLIENEFGEVGIDGGF